MTALQRRLIVYWIALTTVVAAFLLTMSNWVLLALAVGSIFDRSLHSRVYSIAPTMQEYFAGSVLWKRFLILYGSAMAAVAIYLSTYGRYSADNLGKHHMIGLLGIIFGPLIFPLVIHQYAVFRKLGEADDS